MFFHYTTTNMETELWSQNKLSSCAPGLKHHVSHVGFLSISPERIVDVRSVEPVVVVEEVVCNLYL